LIILSGQTSVTSVFLFLPAKSDCKWRHGREPENVSEPPGLPFDPKPTHHDNKVKAETLLSGFLNGERREQ